MSNDLSLGLWQVINPLTGFSPSPKHTRCSFLPLYRDGAPACPCSCPLHVCAVTSVVSDCLRPPWTIACQVLPDKVQEWVAIPPQKSSRPQDRTLVSRHYWWQVGCFTTPSTYPGSPTSPSSIQRVFQPHPALELKLLLKIPTRIYLFFLNLQLLCLPLSSNDKVLEGRNMLSWSRVSHPWVKSPSSKLLGLFCFGLITSLGSKISSHIKWKLGRFFFLFFKRAIRSHLWKRLQTVKRQRKPYMHFISSWQAWCLLVLISSFHLRRAEF